MSLETIDVQVSDLSFNVSGQLLKDTVFKKADQIATQIQSTEAAYRFWQAREKMERHEKAQQLFEELKRKTNHVLVLEEQYSPAHERTIAAQAQVDGIVDELAQIPIAMQYKESQEELNGMVQEVMKILMTRLSSVVPVEYGAKQGCGQGHDGNGCSCGNS
jgi:cell fate (sporulation/competence/biofilm development) regulator YmcA (YheA/YmcA/DUF963 family)